ncbi:MAG TPA: hypothetical protein VNS58_15305 [Puia sp.]|nr:hypothetical protein [Puia sp.]
MILKIYKELLIDDDFSGSSIKLLMLELFSGDKQLTTPKAGLDKHP